MRVGRSRTIQQKQKHPDNCNWTHGHISKAPDRQSQRRKTPRYWHFTCRHWHHHLLPQDNLSLSCALRARGPDHHPGASADTAGGTHHKGPGSDCLLKKKRMIFFCWWSLSLSLSTKPHPVCLIVWPFVS